MYNDLSDFGWGFVHRRFSLRRETSPRDQVEATFALLDATRTAASQLAGADLGGVVDLPLSREALVELLDQCESWIRECDSFWKLSRTERADAMDCQEAAPALAPGPSGGGPMAW